MPTAGSLNNPVLSNEDELSNLLSQLRLSQRSQSQATASPPPSLRRSLRGESDRRRRPPPVHQPFLAQLALSPERISLASSVNQDNSSNSAASQSNEPDPQSPVSSDEFTDARSHLSSSGYGDSSFDNTVASIAQDDLLSMGDAGPEARRPGTITSTDSFRPSTPPPAVATGTDNNPVYSLASPTRSGLVQGWSTAGHHALPDPAAYVKRLTPRRVNNHRPFPFHVVVKGLAVGVFESHWHRVKPLTDKVSGSLYKGFRTRQEAECAYVVAYGLGVVQVLDGSSATSSSSSSITSLQSIVRAQPTEEEILAALQRASDTFLGDEWYAVFKGVRPGVYPTWLAVGNLVNGVSTATYKRFSTKAAAEESYRQALQNGEVHILQHGVSYLV